MAKILGSSRFSSYSSVNKLFSQGYLVNGVCVQAYNKTVGSDGKEMWGHESLHGKNGVGRNDINEGELGAVYMVT